MEKTTYRIHETRIPYLEEKLTKLNKKASKLGCKPITYTVISTEKEIDKEGSIDIYYNITVSGETPKINGWIFLGTIETTENGNIIRKAPDADIPLYFRTIKTGCDHCHSNRYRKNTFIVHNSDTGEYKQVGRQCLRDFLGHTDPERYADWAEYLGKLDEELSEEEEGYSARIPREEKPIDLLSYLEYVSACIKRYGWISATKRRELLEACVIEEEQYSVPDTTAQRALNEMFPFSEKYRDIFPDNSDTELAKKAIDWALSLTDLTNDYLYTINLIAKNGHLKWKESGFSASIVSSYQREQRKQQEQQEKAKENAKKVFIGSVGQKLKISVKVKSIHYFDSQYGTRKLINFSDSEGNWINYWTSEGTKFEIEEGQEYTIQGTVKEHNYYKDIPQTTLTRCKVIA